MNAMIVAPRTTDWHRLKALVLDSVSSPITKRVYNLGLDEFFEWFGQEPRPGFTKATVSAWRVALEARGLGSVSINVRITAVRKLAVEAADNGLLAPALAAGITRVKGAKSKGVRVGNWLSLRQAQALLNAPDTATKKGLRNRAMLAILLSCGLRRSEVAALTLAHIQQRDNRWCIIDLVGKHGRVRTIPVPTWVKGAIDAWISAAGFAEGPVLRPVNRGDQVQGVGMSEKVVWQLLQQYAAAAFRALRLMTLICRSRYAEMGGEDLPADEDTLIDRYFEDVLESYEITKQLEPERDRTRSCAWLQAGKSEDIQFTPRSCLGADEQTATSVRSSTRTKCSGLE